MKYYNVRQFESTDCAAASLATISLYYGLDLSISKIRDLCGTDIKGTSVAGLATCAEKLNYEVKCVRIDKSKLLNSKLVYPFVAHGVHEGLSHFIVVYKFTKNHVIVGNPASSQKKMRIDNFMDFFDGVIVLLKPNQNFMCGKTTGKSMISRFIKLLLPHKKLMIYSIIASAFLTLLGIVSNFFNQILIDDILPYNLKSQLNIFCIGFLIITLLNITLGAIRQHIMLYLSQKVDINISLGYFKHMLRLPFSFFSTRKTGDILVRYQDAGTITNVLTSIALSLLMDLILAVGTGIVLYFMCPKLFVIIVILTLINVLLVYLFKKPYKKINEIQMEQNSKLSSSIIESLEGIEMIKTNMLEEDRLIEIEEKNVDVLKTGFKENVLSNGQSVISNLISALGNIAIIWIGARYVMNGDITLGLLMSFMSMTNFFMSPIGRIVGLQLQIQESEIASKRLAELYDTDEEDIFKKDDAVIRGNIVIKNLEFSYNNTKNVIDGINYKIEENKKIAIVGQSGSGKTTFAKLLFGLYTKYDGEILYDDKSLNDIGLYNIRNNISYVSQNVNLFSGTIKDNFKMVNKNITDDEITKILKVLGCDFIFKMPSGINTYLEDKGSNLSGGERQKLAIARAVIKDANILILDEATSNLDFISEAKIYDALFNLPREKTMIFIAHRLSSIKNCDEIVVFDKGVIVEKGSHDELMANKGTYYKLWTSQNVYETEKVVVKENVYE